MNERTQLLATIKRLLKARGLTYREVGQALGLSEPTVKRLFSSERLTVDRLADLAQLLGYTMAELLQESASALPELHTLSAELEALLVADPAQLLVAVCAFNHWTAAQITRSYRLSPAECLQRLLVLDRMGVIALLPGDRIRLRVARDFDWLPDGPIRRFFATRGLKDFLASNFKGPAETLDFAHGMLTRAAQAELQNELRRLRARIAALHEASATAPQAERHGCGLLMALREWEPAEFSLLRRQTAAGA